MMSRLQYQDWRRVLEQKDNKRKLIFAISILLNLVIGVVIVGIVSRSGILYKGSDSMYHIYRGDWVLKSVESGDGWPLYNPVWYNGVELMRYWPPVAAYLMAFCQFIARSLPGFFPSYYVFEGFAVFCGIVYLIGAVAWNIAGYVKKRPFLGAVLGFLWFFMPQSLHVLFAEGNMPRSLIMAIFPLTLVFMNEYLKRGGIKNFIGTAVTFFLMCACHVGYTGMVALAVLIYFLIYRLCCFTGSGRLQRSKKRDFELIVAVIAGFLLCGVFLLPALKGGLASNTSNASQAAEGFFQSIDLTLNPAHKINSGFGDSYFGIISFLVAVFGAVASKKRARAGFITAIIIVLSTTKTAYAVIQLLPGASLLWMLRFLPIASAMIFFSMLEWDSLKKSILSVITAFMLVDSAICVYALRPEEEDTTSIEGYFESLEEDTLIDEAKAITKNRIALIDSYSPFVNGVFYLSDYNGESTNQLFGQGWEAASTSLQIAQINEAFDNGYYYFMFDRLLEYGCDTVLIKKNSAAVIPYNEIEAEEAATKRGYVKEYEEGIYVVYHYEGITGTYGTISTYDGLAIGSGAYYISMMFPTVREAPTEYIDEFTLEELTSYNIIYLDGFLYHDVHAAEDLITKAAEAGTKVYVLADGIPENAESRTNRFLDVECQPVEFDNGFPEMKTKEFGDLQIALFPNDLKQWRTVYVNGLTEVLGYSEVLGEELPFWGTGSNENIVFIAYNLTYYYSLTRDSIVGTLLEGIVETGETEIPERRIVPVDVTYGENSLTIVSPEDGVNTSVADHDIFEGDYESFNRLVYVDSGTTEITFKYPYLVQGLIMTFAGVLVTGVMVIYLKKKGKQEHT